MGALHEGHISLITLAKKEADLVVCSIFVNPSQFNNSEDLLKYPRTLEKDTALLNASGCDVLFIPSVEEIYPAGLDVKVQLDLGNLDKVMEGVFRPGHFKGMLEVVKRLLDIVSPDLLIMGQKDFQQFTLVQHMIQQLKIPVKLKIGQTLRESDGLAMSSRNVRLTPEWREKVPIIYKSLLFIQSKIGKLNISEILMESANLLQQKGLKVEYLEIVDGKTLISVKNPDNHRFIIACIAIWAGEIRLIDNILLKGSFD